MMNNMMNKMMLLLMMIVMINIMNYHYNHSFDAIFGNPFITLPPLRLPSAYMSCQTKNSARFDAEIQAEIGKLEEDVTTFRVAKVNPTSFNRTHFRGGIKQCKSEIPSKIHMGGLIYIYIY